MTAVVWRAYFTQMTERARALSLSKRSHTGLCVRDRAGLPVPCRGMLRAELLEVGRQRVAKVLAPVLFMHGTCGFFPLLAITPAVNRKTSRGNFLENSYRANMSALKQESMESIHIDSEGFRDIAMSILHKRIDSRASHTSIDTDIAISITHL